MKPILECKGLSKKYNKSAYALHNLNLTLNHGQIIGLLGPNGSGKTTLIKLINDLLTPTEGTVLIDGELPGVHSKNIVSYLPDHSYLDGSMKIQDLVSYFADFYEDFSEIRATSMLKDLNIDQTARLKTLSKGNQQKVQLAATLVADPDIVILDEPFSGLDPVNSQILKDVINELIADGKIVIFSSHQMSYVEEFCEDIVVINHGEVALAGNLDKIKEEYGKGHKAVAAVGMESEELEQILRDKFADQVQVISHNKHHVVTQILPEQDEWQVLSRFKELGIRLRSYGVYEPSLNDIFVSAVGDEETPEDIKEKNNIGTSFSEFEPKQKKGLFGKRG